MHILKKRAVEAISQKLNLSVTGSEQDWDIELADPTRINEFLTVFKQDSSLDSEQKYTLMALILASYEDALQEGKPLVDNWEYIKETLKDDLTYSDLVDYWSLPTDSNEVNLFKITPYIRLLGYHNATYITILLHRLSIDQSIK